MAVNCTDSPSTTEELAGVTAIELNTAGVTVRTVEPLTDPNVAVIVVVPCAALDANPLLLMGATGAAVELHVAVEVRFCVEPSE